MSTVSVRNLANKPIESLRLLIEFVDSDGNHVETGLYYATTGQFADELLQVQKGFGIRKLPKAIGPNQDLDLSSISDIVPFGCPSKGVVSKVDLHFADGSTWMSLDKMLCGCKINSLQDFLRRAFYYESDHVRSGADSVWPPTSPISLPPERPH